MERGWSQSRMASNISFPRRGSFPIAVASQKKKMFSLKDKFKLSSLTREEIIAFFCSLSISLYKSGLTRSRCVLLLLFSEEEYPELGITDSALLSISG